jgi:hypothetical protein
LNLLGNCIVSLANCSEVGLDCSLVLLDFLLERVKFRFELTDGLLEHRFSLRLFLISGLHGSCLAFSLPFFDKSCFFSFKFDFEGILAVEFFC